MGGASHANIGRNVDRNGRLNLGILRQWDPETTMSTVCSLFITYMPKAILFFPYIRWYV